MLSAVGTSQCKNVHKGKMLCQLWYPHGSLWCGGITLRLSHHSSLQGVLVYYSVLPVFASDWTGCFCGQTACASLTCGGCRMLLLLSQG